MANNWYSLFRQARQALPIMEDMPMVYEKRGIDKVDAMMRENVAEQESKIYPDLKYLGHGGYGLVGESLGKAIKYTTEKDEIDTAVKLLKAQKNRGVKHLPGIVAIYNIRKMNPSLAAIEIEKVKPLSGEDNVRAFYLLSRNTDIPDVHEQLKRNVPENVLVAMEQGIANVKHLATELKLNIVDFHDGNVGFNSQGEFVVLDLGAFGTLWY